MQKASEPLIKVTLNLYERDVTDLRNLYGWGWSEIVRGWVRDKLNRNRHEHGEHNRRTNG